MKKTLWLAAGVLAAGLTASAAYALPAGGALPSQKPADAGTIVDKGHGCHRTCQRGPAGWHYHVGPRCVRVACGAPPPGRWWLWRCADGRCGYWHRHDRRWF